jgi:Pyridoxamine 5'-phosphate oxidase
VHETEGDIEALQELLDRSYAAAGGHLRGIHTESRRMTARDLADRLQGMRLLVLATVSSDGRPLTGPVDGIFHRGAFCFGTDQSALRWRHVQRNRAVSATHVPEENWAVTVHGIVTPVDVGPADPKGLRATLLDVYGPRYGPSWEKFLDSGPLYARIEPQRMFAMDVTRGSSEASEMLEQR